MKTLTKTAIAAIAIAALASVSTAAYAADPVDLPAGDVIYQGSYSGEPALLWSTAADGSATLIGTPETTGLDDSTDGAWDPTTGKSYVIGNGYDGPCELWEADVATGQFTYLFDITVPNPEEPTADCDAFDIAPDGTAWVTLFAGEVIAKLNLTDGTTSAHVEIQGEFAGVSWIAVQPSTGTVYLGDFSTEVYTIDPATGVLTFVGDADDAVEGTWYDAAFDTSGRLWITTWPEDTALYSTDVADFVANVAFQGIIDGDFPTGTDSIWIPRAPVVAPVEPVLAATGLETTGALGAGLALLVLGAGAFVVARTRRA